MIRRKSTKHSIAGRLASCARATPHGARLARVFVAKPVFDEILKDRRATAACGCATAPTPRGIHTAHRTGMASNPDRQWTWRLGRLFASLARKLDYPSVPSVPVSAAMLSRVDTVGADKTLGDAATLVARGTGPLPVIDDDGHPVGIVTRNALTHALVESGPRASIAFASCANVIEVAPSASADEVLARLKAQPDSVAMVVDRGAPVGMLTMEQLERYLSTRERA